MQEGEKSLSKEGFPELAYLVERIKEARAEQGWSQRAFAEKLGLTAGHIGHIESRKLNLSLSTIVKIAAVLEKPLRYFFPYQGDFDEPVEQPPADAPAAPQPAKTPRKRIVIRAKRR